MSRYAQSPLVQLTLWRLRDFLREPEAMFWIFAFPIVLALALGLAFKSRGPEIVHIAVESGPGAAELHSTLVASPQVEAVLLDSSAAYDRLRTGQVALVVRAGDPLVFQYDSTRSESFVARLVADKVLQQAAGREDVWEVRSVRITEPGARYIDFLIPGLIGMNIMGTGMWGVGFGIVKNRNYKLLKRLRASPMRKRTYLLSHILARLVFLVFEVGAVLVFGVLVFGVPVRGSLLAIGLITLIGAMSFAGLGLLVASRVRTIEGVSGLMNLIMVPMWIGSGVFFAYTNFPSAIHPFLRGLPLTALNDALRAVMLEGSHLLVVSGPLIVLGLWTVGSFGVALRVFRWD